MSEPPYPGWTKDSDGFWRHPRYPSGSKRTKAGLSVEYDLELNGAVLTVDGHSVPLSFWELSNLLNQLYDIKAKGQAENAILMKEKEEVRRVMDGVEPAVYERGIRLNPPTPVARRTHGKGQVPDRRR